MVAPTILLSWTTIASGAAVAGSICRGILRTAWIFGLAVLFTAVRLPPAALATFRDPESWRQYSCAATDALDTLAGRLMPRLLWIAVLYATSLPDTRPASRIGLLYVPCVACGDTGLVESEPCFVCEPCPPGCSSSCRRVRFADTIAGGQLADAPPQSSVRGDVGSVRYVCAPDCRTGGCCESSRYAHGYTSLPSVGW
jgi:hypothetical protein